MAGHGSVIIVGESADPHVLSVRSELERRGARCLVLDEDHTRVRVSYVDSRVRAEARFGSSWLPLDSARAVWWWRKETTIALSHRGDFAADFAMREYRDLLESLEWLLPEVRWPIKPSTVRRASLKCRQLAVAQEMGFKIPVTMVTNDSPSIVDFVHDRPASFQNGVIYKPLTWYVAPPDRFLYADMVTVDELESSSASISRAPCQFQEFVSKSHELRATVVGPDVFAVRIDSQARVDTKVDWRRNQGQVPYSVVQLSSDLTGHLHEYLTACGLTFGSFDLVVSPDGSVTFLELNPMGQWLWLEERLGLKISGAVANLLVSG